MLTPSPPLSPPLPDDDLELGEAVVARWDDAVVQSSMLGPGKHTGRLLLTDRYLRFTGGGGLGRMLLHGMNLPSFLPSQGPSRLIVPIARVLSVKSERSLRLFHRLRLGLEGGDELVISLGVGSPEALLRAFSGATAKTAMR